MNEEIFPHSLPWVLLFHLFAFTRGIFSKQKSIIKVNKNLLYKQAEKNIPCFSTMLILFDSYVSPLVSHLILVIHKMESNGK